MPRRRLLLLTSALLALMTADAHAAVTPVRIAAGGAALTDSAGRRWQADGYFTGGKTIRATKWIAGTATPGLYQRARTGAMSYAIPVPAAATYSVTLFLAEVQGRAPGTRVFDVAAEGGTRVKGVDIAAAAGPLRAHHEVFTVPVADGTLNLQFVPRIGDPTVSGIEVQTYKASIAGPQTLLRQDFDEPAGTLPSGAVWTPDSGGSGFGNNELQAYTGRPENAATDGLGRLAITARRESYRSLDGTLRDYTSARLQTRSKFEFQYGRAEARLQVPSGKGLWPAFWTLGHDAYGALGWPASGEIDIMEVLGDRPGTAYAHLHGPMTSGGAYGPGASVSLAPGLDAGFHTFGVLWVPGAVQMSLDGVPYLTVTPTDLPATNTWVFDRPNFLLLNLAVGGDWPGAPDATTPFPARLLVDSLAVTR